MIRYKCEFLDFSGFTYLYIRYNGSDNYSLERAMCNIEGETLEGDKNFLSKVLDTMIEFVTMGIQKNRFPAKKQAVNMLNKAINIRSLIS